MNEGRVVRAAGIAVARPANGEWEFLLVRSRFTGDWGCAKGHCEPGETDLQTAHREVLEETGISGVAVVEGSHEVRYTLRRGGGTKHVVYFAGTVARDTPLELDRNECNDGDWFTLKRALERVTHADMRDVLTWASRVLGNPPALPQN
jgi:8-oxo-dGTP pyrophosphatase MutT (NUDIX family)